jgi:glyoxylase-like metal-dependent hydrolase (beta-lactamase superfamily II)
MKLFSIEGNTQRLDGGSMFGNVPRALWEKWVQVDDQHRVPLACRCLLAELDDGRRILFETGVGAFFAPELKERFGVLESGHVLLENLAKLGLSDQDIDVVVLSHLHFDHAGGLLAPWKEGAAASLLFPNARFIVGEKQWLRANQPHARDRASYVPELNALLEESGRLELVVEGQATPPGLPLSFTFSDGHTPGLMLAQIETQTGPLVFCSDLIPGRPWVHLPVCMGYDRYPECLIDEKKQLLEKLIANDGYLFFTHDANDVCGKVLRTARGKFDVNPQLMPSELTI